MSRRFDGLAARSHVYNSLGAQLKKEKKQCRKSILRLVKRGLIEIAVTDKRRTPLWFQLTEEGRKTAEELEREETPLRDMKEALRLLKTEGQIYVTLDEVRELLWQVSGWKFNNRGEFEKYWTKRKMGLTIKKMGLKQGWSGPPEERIRTYILTVNCTDDASKGSS